MILTFLYNIYSYTIYPLIIGYNYIKSSFYGITYNKSYYLYKKHDNELYEYYTINRDTNSIYYYMLRKDNYHDNYHDNYNDNSDHNHVLNNINHYDTCLLNASLFLNDSNNTIIDITSEFKKFVYYNIKHKESAHHIILNYIKKLHNLNHPFSIEIMYNDDNFSTITLTF
jgi:hypothetical protein